MNEPKQAMKQLENTIWYTVIALRCLFVGFVDFVDFVLPYLSSALSAHQCAVGVAAYAAPVFTAARAVPTVVRPPPKRKTPP